MTAKFDRRGACKSQEGPLLDKQSLRLMTGKTADWKELCKDCVAFANASGAVERKIPRLANGPDDGLWNGNRKFFVRIPIQKVQQLLFQLPKFG
jgi:hypothetical protein